MIPAADALDVGRGLKRTEEEMTDAIASVERVLCRTGTSMVGWAFDRFLVGPRFDSYSSNLLLRNFDVSSWLAGCEREIGSQAKLEEPSGVA